MRSSNPVLSRLTPETHTGYAAAPVGYGQGATTYPAPQTVISTPATDRMTVDDVVVRTVGLLTLTAVVAGLSAAIVPLEYTGVAWVGAAIVGLILGLVIALAKITNPLVIATYAAVEGVFVGMVSKTYETLYSGIVVQAAIGTFGVFFLMAALYRARVIRATPKFVRMVMGALVGVVALIVINLVLSFFGVSTGLRGNADGSVGWLAIGFSLVCIVVAALTFVLDFAYVEEGVRAGLPKRYAWSAAFGILVGLIWLYIEILRLLSYLRGDD